MTTPPEVLEHVAGLPVDSYSEEALHLGDTPVSKLSPRVKNTRQVLNCDDDKIMVRHRATNGLKTYYSIGTKITVVWYGGGKHPYVCLTCIANECPHVTRVDRWRGEQFS